MTHYWIEMAFWMAALFLAGCPLGAAARRLWERRGGGKASGGS